MKKHNFFLIVFIIAFSSLRFYNVEGLDINDFINARLNKTYGLPNEVLTLSVDVSYIGFNLKIYYPNGSLAYDNNFQGSSRQIPITIQEPYGFYKIIISIPDLTNIIWFTSLDVYNFTLVEMPYVVSHKGIDYSFNRDWSLTANSLIIDFHFIRDLIDRYDLDYTVLNNDMNFLIRLRKNDVFKCDIVFSFIYEGCKFSINGTQDKIREFTLNMPYAKKIRNSFKRGNTVFDFSDIPKSSYLIHNKAVIITVPKTFNIDPVIFEDGFESGDKSAWTGSTGTVNVVSDWANTGTYSAQSTGSAGSHTVYYNSASATEWYARVTFNASTLVGVGKYRVIIQFEKQSDSSRVGAVIWDNSGGTYRLWLQDPGGSNVGTYNFPSLSQYDVFEVQFHMLIHGTTGKMRLWLDDTLQIDYSGDTDNNGNFDKFVVGNRWSSETVNHRFDDCALDDEKLPTLTGVSDTTPPQWSGLTESSTLAGNSTTFNSYWYDVIGNLSHYIFNWNNTGSYVNDSASSFPALNNTWLPITKTLNSTVGLNICWRVYGNDTSNNWNTTNLRCIITTVEGRDFTDIYVLTVIGLATILLSVLGYIAEKGMLNVMAIALSVITFLFGGFPLTTPAYFLGFEVAVIFVNLLLSIATYGRVE